MGTQRLSPAPGGGKVVSGSGSDPRIGAKVDKPESHTIRSFNSNPFKAGGAQEQAFGVPGYEAERGPAGGRKLKAEPIADKVTNKETGKKFGAAVAGSGVSNKR